MRLQYARFRAWSGFRYIQMGNPGLRVLARKYSPKAWSDGRSGRDGISFRFHPGRRTVGEMMRVDPLSYEELERSGSTAFCSSVKRASDRFQGKNDSGLSTA